MAHHDHISAGYDLVTFSSQSDYIGRVNHRNLDAMWGNIRIGGGTRVRCTVTLLALQCIDQIHQVMTGWQKVKELHFKKHSESATWHPIL